jgi:tight adherence protein C
MSNVALLIGLMCIGGSIMLAVLVLTKNGVGDKKPAREPGLQQVPQPIGAVGPGLGAATSYPMLAAPLVSAAKPAGGASNRAVVQELPPLLRRLRQLALRLSPSGYAHWLRRRLDLAGNPPKWPADRVLAFKGIGLVAGLLLGALLGLGHGLVLVLLAVGGAAIGFFLADVVIYNRGTRRQGGLLKGLPDALDMMTVCVEAGLGFDAALSRVALNLEGPIAVECARVLQEMQFGMSRAQALRSLAGRTSVSEIRAFVSAVVQSSELGMSVGVVLREQAKEMRIRRRQRAEEKAQKLQVKIVVPLVLCLLPALFIVVIGPGILNIVHAFSNAHH